jgi:hypothetical protein
MAGATALEALRDRWMGRWPEALALWSPFTRLRPPRFCLTEEDERREGLSGSFAMIRLVDQSVVVSVRQVAGALEEFPLEVLGHEIGHHILCPADLSDNARMLARIRRALPTVEKHAAMVGNLYADLLINDRLQRSRQLDMAGVYAAAGGSTDRFWTFYMRIYEILWALPTGRLAAGELDDRVQGDAGLGARLVRSFSGRWLAGSGRFGALCLPYLLDDATPESAAKLRLWQDAVGAGVGGFPDGLTGVDPDEEAGSLHPSLDPELGGAAPAAAAAGGAERPVEPEQGGGRPGQYRQPFEYGQLLRDCGLELDDQQVAVRYYRERAAPAIIPFPTRRSRAAGDPLPEGVESWDIGEPINDIDWFETLLRSPDVVPGVTTVKRLWAQSSADERARLPVDLDIYVDSSGSMPNPQVTVSYLTLAGAVIALSALRAGAAVQATLWSGAGQFTSTSGFVRDETAVLRVLTGFFGGATAFPVHVLRDTYQARPAGARPAHVLVVSDDGVTTMYDADEAGRDGREVARHALAVAGGGATMALNLWAPIEQSPALVAMVEDGWDIHVVHDWTDMVEFARAFSRRQYVDHGPRRP